MRKPLTLLAATIAALAGLALIAPAQAAMPAAPAQATSQAGQVHYVSIVTYADGHTEKTVDGKRLPAVTFPAFRYINAWYYTGQGFQSEFICQDNNIGTTYPLQTAGNYFESGLNTVTLAFEPTETTANCANYSDAQTIHYSVYNDGSANAGCYKTSGFTAGQTWTHNDTQINNYPDIGCGSTAQARANAASGATGNAVGLEDYFSSAETGCVMNKYWQPIYYWAGSCDRNRLYYIYN